MKDNAKRGVMLQGMFRSNFVLFGIPISTTLYGDTAAGLASILIAVIIPLYNALAVVALEMFNGKKPSFFKILFGILTNPLILASAAGILFVVFQVPPAGHGLRHRHGPLRHRHALGLHHPGGLLQLWGRGPLRERAVPHPWG